MNTGIAPIYPAYYYSASPTFNKWVRFTAADVCSLRTESGFDGQNIFFHLNHPIRFVYLLGSVVAIDVVSSKYVLLELDDGSGATIEVKITRVLPAAGRDRTASNDASIGLEDDKQSVTDVDDDSRPETNPLISTKRFKSAGLNSLNPLTTETTTANLKVTSIYGDHRLYLENTEIDIGTVLKVKGTLQLYKSLLQLTLLRAFHVRTINEEICAWNEYARFCEEVLSKPWILSGAEEQSLQASEQDRLKKEREKDRVDWDQARRKADKIRDWHTRKRRHEEKADRRRDKESRFLDGNALDRPGWQPCTNTHDIKMPTTAQIVSHGVVQISKQTGRDVSTNTAKPVDLYSNGKRLRRTDLNTLRRDAITRSANKKNVQL